MIDLQSIANQIRDRLLENDAVSRLGIEVLWAAGSPDHLTIRVRHRDRVLTVERGARWHRRPPDQQAAELAHELVGHALDTLRATPSPPSWPRSAEEPDATRAHPDLGPQPAGPVSAGP